jgi:hypothetical protein
MEMTNEEEVAKRIGKAKLSYMEKQILQATMRRFVPPNPRPLKKKLQTP